MLLGSSPPSSFILQDMMRLSHGRETLLAYTGIGNTNLTVPPLAASNFFTSSMMHSLKGLQEPIETAVNGAIVLSFEVKKSKYLTNKKETYRYVGPVEGCHNIH